MRNAMKPEKSRKRVTKKSRMLDAITDSMLELIVEQDDCCPSIGRISNMIADENLSEDANSAIRTLVLDEVTNDVTRYFQECCRIVSKRLGDVPYHFVTNKFYSKRYREPTNEAEARKYLAMFANGRGRNIEGARFLNSYQESKSDPMYAVYIKQRAEIDAKKTRRTAKLVANGFNHGALTNNDVEALPPSVKDELEDDEDNS